MKNYSAKEIKNIVLIGAPGSGKTTLAEAMAFEGKVIDRRGSIETNNTLSDNTDIEHEYKRSIYSTILQKAKRSGNAVLFGRIAIDKQKGIPHLAKNMIHACKPCSKRATKQSIRVGNCHPNGVCRCSSQALCVAIWHIIQLFHGAANCLYGFFAYRTSCQHS